MRNKYRYTVYAQIETPDSIEYGCIEDQTCIASGISLHEAFKTLWSTRTNMVDPAIETDCALTSRGVSFLVVNGHEFETDCRETRMLNIFCTKSSAGRLMRLVASQ